MSAVVFFFLFLRVKASIRCTCKEFEQDEHNATQRSHTSSNTSRHLYHVTISPVIVSGRCIELVLPLKSKTDDDIYDQDDEVSIMDRSSVSDGVR